MIFCETFYGCPLTVVSGPRKKTETPDDCNASCLSQVVGRICMSVSTRGPLLGDPAGRVRSSRVRRNVRSANGIVHQRSTLLRETLRLCGLARRGFSEGGSVANPLLWAANLVFSAIYGRLRSQRSNPGRGDPTFSHEESMCLFQIWRKSELSRAPF